MTKDDGLSEKPLDEGTAGLEQAYQNKGFQKQNFKEYLAQKKQRDLRKKAGMPAIVKTLLISPFVILFIIGLIFIPYMIYLYATSG